jgi:hypothetical protein
MDRETIEAITADTRLKARAAFHEYADNLRAAGFAEHEITTLAIDFAVRAIVDAWNSRYLWTCKSCGAEFVPSDGEFARCASCVYQQHAAAEYGRTS